jgi:hypothetical protein
MGKETTRIIAKLDKVTGEEMVDLVFRIHGRLVEETPVDTGWARNNWLPSVGKPITEPVGEPGKPEPGVATRGLGEVGAAPSILAAPVHITNNVPYIQRLNAGSSSKAPAGFVERIVQEEVNRSNKRRLDDS